MNTFSADGFDVVSPLSFLSKASGSRWSVAGADVVRVVVHANMYLSNLVDVFREIECDIYSTLGQRNISGFVGEVFTRSFPIVVAGLAVNPHADGRPDILDISSPAASNYLNSKCFSVGDEGNAMPVRSELAPFPFGGLEVKATIGNLKANSRAQGEPRAAGANGFAVGVPRIDCLGGITYWGHHTSCENLIGLYYDYNVDLGGAPQIMAVMHSELIADEDWSAVSVGKAGSKKTSNTSLTASGRAKMYQGVSVVVSSDRYKDQLRRTGLSV